MLARCYSEKVHLKQPTYIGCTVVKDWLTFFNFKQWMVTREWKGNKVYSPETCIFIPQKLNSFITDSSSTRGQLPIGVTFSKVLEKYKAYCRDLFTGTHLAWKQYKHKLALQYAEQQTDTRIIEVLINKYK